MKWIADHTNYLINNYRTQSVKNIAQHLGRTERSIRKKIGYLGLALNGFEIWNDNELQILDQNKHRKVQEYMNLLPGRTKKGIYQKNRKIYR